MIKMKKIELNKIKKFIKKTIRILAVNVFFGFIFSLIIALLLGGFVFYKYIILITEMEFEISEQLGFNEVTYKKVLSAWQDREKKFEKTISKEYPNPFQEPLNEEELTE